MKADLKKILKFRDDRNWKKFHSPKNLALSLSIEASEILEIFQWTSNNKLDSKRKKELEDEIADVYYYLVLLAEETNIDIKKAFKNKMKSNELKYPASKVKGRSTKYNKL